MARNGSDIWFEYSVVRGRFTAVPVSAPGWVTLIGATTIPTGTCLLMAWILALHPLLLLPLIIVSMAVSFITLFTLVKRKGRLRES